MNMQGGTLHTGQNQKSSVNIDWSMVDACVGLKMMYYKDKGERKDKAHHVSTVRLFRGSSDPFVR